MNLLDKFYEAEKERNLVASKYDEALREVEKVKHLTINVNIMSGNESLDHYADDVKDCIDNMCKKINTVAEERLCTAKSELERLLGVATEESKVNEPEEQKLEEVETLNTEVEQTGQAEEKQDKPWLDKDKLYEEYITNGKTAKEIAEMWGTTKKNVGNALQRFGIKRMDFVPGKQDFSKKKKVTP